LGVVEGWLAPALAAVGLLAGGSLVVAIGGALCDAVGFVAVVSTGFCVSVVELVIDGLGAGAAGIGTGVGVGFGLPIGELDWPVRATLFDGLFGVLATAGVSGRAVSGVLASATLVTGVSAAGPVVATLAGVAGLASVTVEVFGATCGTAPEGVK
jgi:hypothetical protein